MAVRPYTTDPATLSAAAAVVGAAAPDLTTRVIKSATITNPTGAAIAGSVYMVPSGAVAGAGNVMISARPIAAGESYPCPELISQGLNAGGTLQALGAGLVIKYTATDFV
jgi:hypothetical protein